MCYFYLNTSGYNPCRMGWMKQRIVIAITTSFMVVGLQTQEMHLCCGGK